ncbi:MAG: GNAT family N-acetyltransferase [Bdellovibrionota bacterium]
MATIRPLTTDDAPRIFEVIEKATVQARVPIGPIWTQAQVENECVHGGWVLELEDAAQPIMAFIFVWDIGSAWEISFLATDPAARGQGLMRRLIEYVKSIRPADKPLWLEVHEKNEPARKLYEKAGFNEVGRRAEYYSDGGTAVLYNFDS